jgi:ribonucleoside-diphosphate reductase alpha chain
MSTKLEQRIISQKIVKDNRLANVKTEIVPLEREEVITGQTYKIKPVCIDHAVYITINNQIIEGVCRPFEIFINSKDITYFMPFILLSRLLSAIWRKGGDYKFVCGELEAIYEPKGGYHGKNHITGKKGYYYSSIFAEIGLILEKHIKETCED